MSAPAWEPDPKCGCFACRLEVPKVMREPELTMHLIAYGKANAKRGASIAGSGWEALRSYLFRWRLPEWFETALLQHHVDTQMAETRLAHTLMHHYDDDRARAVIAAFHSPPLETVEGLRAELVDMREQYAQAMARHGKVIA